jgi:CsoR family transcriptional regulator, copper-sensing transcriptional repressor
LGGLRTGESTYSNVRAGHQSSRRFGSGQIPYWGIASAVVTGYVMGKDDLLQRLCRIEGQVRGIAQMVEDDRYCIDVLTQVAAATKGLQSVAVGMFDEHLRHCVADAVANGGPDADRKLTEATAAVERLLKS